MDRVSRESSGLTPAGSSIPPGQASKDEQSLATELLRTSQTTADQPASGVKLINKVEVFADPRKKMALQKNLLGKIMRIGMKVFGMEGKLKTWQKQAHALNVEQTLNKVLAFTTRAKGSAAKGAPAYLKEGKAQLPEEINLDELEKDYQDGSRIDKKVLAEVHVKEKIWEQGIPDIPSLSAASWHPIRCTSDGLVDGQVSTTSERARGKTDLNNAYVRISDNGSIQISTGAIDNQTRADEFMQVVVKALKMWEKKNEERRTPPQLRISLHQLNAFGFLGIGETPMIKRQHKMVAYIEANLRDRLKQGGVSEKWLPRGPVISQLNRTLNGFSRVPGENDKCQAVNRYGLAVQTSWMHEDVIKKLPAEYKKGIAYENYNKTQESVNQLGSKLIEYRDKLARLETPSIRTEGHQQLENKLRALSDQEDAIRKQIREAPTKADPKLRASLEQVQNAKESIQASMPVGKAKKAQIKELEKRISAEEKKLSEQLRDLSTTMMFAAAELAESDKDISIRLEMMGKLLAAETGLDKSLGATERLQLMFLVDELNGAVSQSNCKSGLDRTGIARALQSVLLSEIAESEEKDPAKAIYEVYNNVLHFQKTRKQMDQEWAAHKKANPAGSFHDWLKNEEIEIKTGPTFSSIAKSQAKFFAALMGEGLAITVFSTGVPGFKWHHSKKSINPLEKNPHPIPFLPTEVYDSKGNPVTLVEVSATGKRSLTEEGQRILEGLSQKRGA